MIVIETYDTNVVDARLQWTVMELGVWRKQEMTSQPKQLECFEVGDAEAVDVVHRLNGDPTTRGTIYRWEREWIDLEGCFLLCRPVQAFPTSNASGKDFPILGLIDALEAKQFIPVNRALRHSRVSGLFYDSHSRNCRPYLQAVLCCDWLFDKGQGPFSSRMPASFYQLIMLKPGTVSAALSGRDYQKVLATLDPDMSEIPAALMEPKPPRIKRCVVDSQVDVDDGSVFPMPGVPRPSDEADGDDEASACESSSSGSSSSSSSSRDSKKISADGSDEDELSFPKLLSGCPLKREQHKDSGDDGLRVTCKRHVNCRRFRSLKLDVGLYGERAAFYFLGAWLQCDGDRKTHQDFRPKRDDVRKFIVASES
jgi:hypothetical protein